ncbi:MAG TPA: CocE/NonD family hydrolase [Rhodanobacteraceae bacterium]|nr:CocE/NonD family hydrolase [Rhodanobacteraceae bacterium]
MRVGLKLSAGLLCAFAAMFSIAAFAADKGDNREDVVVDLHHMIPMRDGVQLAATIWRPSNQAKPLPAVLVMTPYITDETQARAVKFATHGYVYVSVDVRGRGTSQGRFTPLYGNGPDGADVIAWLAKQPWCDGRVVTRGGSYRGMDQWQILAEHPPHLAAAVPTAAVYPGWDFPQPRGIFISYMAQWLAYTSGQTGQDNLFGDGKYWTTRFVDAYESNQPFYKLADLSGTNRDAFLQWLDHPAHDAYWAAYNPKPDDYKSIDIPILTITGYFDGDQPGALRYYREFMANASANAKKRFYLLMGPWDHPGTRHPQQKLGGLTFDKKSVLDIDQLHIDFFDWVLKGGKRPGILSDRVNYYVMGADEWRHADALKDLSDHTLRLYLSSPDSDAHDVFHSGFLTTQEPADQPADTFSDDPLKLTPADELLKEQGDDPLVHSAEPFKTDRLIYVSDRLPKAITLAGAMQLLANISLDTPDGDIGAEVDAILPDGRTLVLGQDMMRARFRHGMVKAEPATPGAVEPWRFDGFYFTVRELPKGTRLRLVLAPLNIPDLQKNYNSGGRIGYETAKDARTATFAVHLDPRHPSYLELPLAPEPGK